MTTSERVCAHWIRPSANPFAIESPTSTTRRALALPAGLVGGGGGLGSTGPANGFVAALADCWTCRLADANAVCVGDTRTAGAVVVAVVVEAVTGALDDGVGG